MRCTCLRHSATLAHGRGAISSSQNMGFSTLQPFPSLSSKLTLTWSRKGRLEHLLKGRGKRTIPPFVSFLSLFPPCSLCSRKDKGETACLSFLEPLRVMLTPLASPWFSRHWEEDAAQCLRKGKLRRGELRASGKPKWNQRKRGILK